MKAAGPAVDTGDTLSMRKILILSLTGALVLAGAMVAVARMGGSGQPPAPGNDPSTQPSASPPQEARETPPPPTPTSVATSVRPPAPTLPALPPPAPPQPAFPDPVGFAPTIVTPSPGMDNVHPVNFRRAEVTGDRTLRIHYESGVAPCSVLDRVEVDYRETEIAISLFEGSDPAFKQVACIMIAQFKAVDLTLKEPVGGRAIVEGYR